MKKLMAVALLAVVALLGIFAWPTQWKYETLRHPDGDRMIRISRFDGSVQRLTQYGWVDMRYVSTPTRAESGPPTTLDPKNPYADIVNR